MLARVIIFWALLLIACGYALFRGRKYERIAAVVFLAATVLSIVSRHVLEVRYMTLDLGALVIDSAVLIAVLAIALLSDRFWPLWVAGLQLVASMAHVLKAVTADLPPWAYAIAERFWSYPILIILFIGAWRQHRRSQLEQEFSPVPS